MRTVEIFLGIAGTALILSYVFSQRGPDVINAIAGGAARTFEALRAPRLG